MKDALKVICASAAACAFLACEEETTPPPGEEPLREGTVVEVISDGWDPYYSPDGLEIVFVEAYRLAIYDLVTYQKRALTPDFGSYEHCPRVPVWLSTDVVAFIRKDEASGKYLIWTIPASGGAITKYDVAVDADSSLGADENGRYLYYTAETTYLIWELDLQTGQTRQITKEHLVGYGDFDAVRKPGGNTLYFVQRHVPFSSEPHVEYICEVPISGLNVPWDVLATDKPFLPGLTASPDDKYLVYPHRDGLFALEYRAGKETWLTRAPNTWADKDRRPCYSPNGEYIVFSRRGNIYRCDAP